MRKRVYVQKSYPPLQIPGGGRAKLLELTLSFVIAARQLPGTTRIAMVGSLTTDKPEPKDVDLLVTVLDEADLAPLAKLGRKIQGAAGSVWRGADIFLVDTDEKYLGRTCPWVECEPYRRVRCEALHCGQRPHLYDDLEVLNLAKSLILNPPLELFPEIVVRAALPTDIEQSLLLPLKKAL